MSESLGGKLASEEDGALAMALFCLSHSGDGLLTVHLKMQNSLKMTVGFSILKFM